MSGARAAQPQDINKLYLDNEDDSFEVPDFHFDWGVTKERIRAEEALSAAGGALGRLQLEEAIGRGQTPPTSSGPLGQSTPLGPTISTHSSASSVHVMGLTDASTAAISNRSLSSQVDSGGSSSSSIKPRMYGGRTFHRVVSAPLDRPRFSGDPQSGDESVVRLDRVEDDRRC
jgi:serine/threonine-protein kinase TTK/MPS1